MSVEDARKAYTSASRKFLSKPNKANKAKLEETAETYRKAYAESITED